MADVEPGPGNNYQVGPTLTFSRARWNAVMASIAARLKARELLEATFETLIANGTQAALDLISQNVAPQLEDLIEQINALEEQLEDIIGGGTAPNALQLGGQNPSYYLALANATGTLPVEKVTGVSTLIDAAVASLVNGSPAALDTLKELSDALGGDANFASSVAAALGGKLAKASNLSDLGNKDQALSNLLGGATGIAMFKAATAAAGLTALGLTDRQVPAGSIIQVIGTAAPSGFIKANGAALSRSTYADLWAYAQSSGALVSQSAYDSGQWGAFGAGDGSTTFRIPDLRGIFLRGLDDGRAADPGRVIGAYQASQNLSHGHGINDPGHAHSVYDPAHSHGVNDPGHSHYFERPRSDNQSIIGGASSDYSRPLEGANTSAAGTGIWLSASGTGISIYGAGTGISIQSSGGGEARPQNVPALYCIKY